MYNVMIQMGAIKFYWPRTNKPFDIKDYFTNESGKEYLHLVDGMVIQKGKRHFRKIKLNNKI